MDCAAKGNFLKVFLDMCAEEGVSPYRKHRQIKPPPFPELYDKAATMAKASGKSVNAWIADIIRHADDVLTH
jgi:predicted HicB family RNase H-like nuclease